MDISLNICSKPILRKPKKSESVSNWSNAKITNKKNEKPTKNFSPFTYNKPKSTILNEPKNQENPQQVTNEKVKRFKTANKKPGKQHNTNSTAPKNNFQPKDFPLFSNPRKEKLRINDVKITTKTENVFGSEKINFEDLNVHSYIIQHLGQKGIEKPTDIQQKTIPKILNGDNLTIRSETGSGKTLAYAIPIVQALSGIVPKISRKDGVQALIIVPTRELALQTSEVFTDLVHSFCWIVPGYVCGGEGRKSEKVRLRKGLNILIGTPGRIIDHFLHSTNMKLESIKCLVIDEADSLVEMGHKEDIKKIVNMIEEARNKVYDPMAILKGQNKSKTDETNTENISEAVTMPLMDLTSKKMQTIFLSATLTKKVQELKDLILKDHETIENDTNPALSSSETANVTAPNVNQKYIVTDIRSRLVILSALIMSKINEETCKMFIFMDTRQMVDYHEALFRKCLLSKILKKDEMEEDITNAASQDSDEEDEVSDLQLFKIHGDMAQKDRTATYKGFRSAKKGVLVCTDAAARGIDVPNADFVIQYTAPLNEDVYLHRIGRTARAGKYGESIICITEPEMEYITHIKQEHNVNINRETEENVLKHLIPYMSHVRPHNERVAAEALQKRFESVVKEDSKLLKMGCQAFVSWCKYYRMFPGKLRQFFNAKNLDTGPYIKSFGLNTTLQETTKIARQEVEDENTQNSETPVKKLNLKLSNQPRSKEHSDECVRLKMTKYEPDLS